MTVNIQVLDPLKDSRWDELVAHHPNASAFHSRGWLEALARTYGYIPFCMTSSPAGEALQDGIAVCCVSSWMTGTRLVSLPFSDHCDPLLSRADSDEEFLSCLTKECELRNSLYVELRPLSRSLTANHGFSAGDSYWFHELDLRPSLQQIFEKFHKNSIQRKIRRAEREHLSYEAGRSVRLLNEFYDLLLKTRRRHHALPQPRCWFNNLIRYMGDCAEIRVARKNETPIAAILSLRHRSTVVYKYGCSDEVFHQLGGMPYLFWKLVEESKASGAMKIDFGRTDLDNEGLILFKDRFGTSKKLLTYYRYSRKKDRKERMKRLPALRQVFSILPGSVTSVAGRLLYRHLG